MNQVGIGFIGVGGIAQWQHLKQLSALPQARLIGYYDVDEMRVADTVRQYGGVAFRSMDDLLSDRDIQAVYVCLPPFAHGEAEEKVIAAGKAIFVEKPLATNLTTAERIAKKIGAKKLINAVGYNWRYQTNTAELKRRLKPSDIIGASGWWCGGRPGVWWWRQKKTCGGQHIEQTTHIFDIANYVIDSPPVSVFAVGRKLKHYREPDHTVEDISSVTVTYKNGVIANIWSSDVMGGRSSRVSCEFFGVDRRYELGGTLKCWEKDYIEIQNANDPYRCEDELFLRAVATKNQSLMLATYDTSLVTHRVTMAADRSMKSGKVVTV